LCCVGFIISKILPVVNDLHLAYFVNDLHLAYLVNDLHLAYIIKD